MSWIDRVRGLAGDPVQIARTALSRKTRRPSVAARRRLALTSGTLPPESLALGRAAGTAGWFHLPASRVCTTHGTIAGASGSGKTRLVEGQLVRTFGIPWLTRVILDAKSELTVDLLEAVIPYYVRATGDEAIADRITIIQPFGPHTPPLNITLPEAGVSREAQATSIATSIEESLGEAFGGRMRVILPQLVACAIALERPLTAVVDWLVDPLLLLRELMRCPDVELREFARTLPKESKESLSALSSRLRGLLFLPETRRALSASSCISFPVLLQRPGHTIIVDVGSPPAGSERLLRLFGSLLFGRLVRACLSRHLSESSPHVLAVFEEVQEVLGPNEARSLTRLLSLARHRRTAVWTTNQSRAQLLSVDRTLDQAIRVNVGFQAQFRASLEDAKAFAHLLPRSKSGRPGSRLRAVEGLTRLPIREYFFALRTEALTVRLRSPRFDLEGMKSEASALIPGLLERIYRGQDSAHTLEPAKTPRRSSPFTIFESEVSDEPDEFPALG